MRTPNAEAIRARLAVGPQTGRQLTDFIGISQPTLSRALAELGDDILRIGAARSIQYALRDGLRGLPDIAIHRVDAEGRLIALGTLIPVRPEGFVMREASGRSLHTEGLPWWLYDMRPAGYLGRAWAARHGDALGLPSRLGDWSDTDVLRALLEVGHDLPGNLLLGESARQQFLASPLPTPISAAEKALAYPRLAREAAQGERPGSSAGGEQPKFTACAETANGPRHVIVKFSEADAGAVGERWRDLLLAEHLALETLHAASIAAARTRVIDTAEQRFLEVERFDRIGTNGRHALLSLAALDAEFVGAGSGAWPGIARQLAAARHIRPEAAADASLLWAFGHLIGNTDMHAGNLSFITDDGRPYALAPAYDMTPMAFAPRSGGGLPDTLSGPNIRADITNGIWHRAAALAREFLARLTAEGRFSPRFTPCMAALDSHLDVAARRIARLG